MWKELAQKLNSVGLGQKPVEKWQKSWSDYKQNLKKKAAEINQSINLTGGGPGNGKTLSDFEVKVLSILGDSFYKGVGVQEVGIITNTEPDMNLEIETVESETMSQLEINPRVRFLPATPIQNKEMETEYESMSLLSIAKPPSLKKPIRELQIMSTHQSTLIEPNSPKQKQFSPEIPFRKTTISNNNKKRKIHNLNDNPDHDYLGNLPGPSNQTRRVSTSRNNEENETKKNCEDTVKVLHSIDSNVDRVANSLESLVGEIRMCCALLKNVCESNQKN